MLAAAFAATSVWSQTIVNGDFETGDLPPWTVVFAGSTGGHNAVGYGTANVHSGTYSAEVFDNDGLARLSQSVTTVPGQRYTLSAWVAQGMAWPENVASIGLGAANPPVSCTLGADNVWSLCTGTFTAAGTSERVDLWFGTQPGKGSISFDDVTLTPLPVTAVPALSDLPLLALVAALGALGVARMRRRA